ncbi:hypothetical protein CNMCM5793_002132 [Aspergillus hiratsukae]|uniref:Uncharacterized protein n=1 Tax=Aspergillus hiratsukae TaxID=1194566 RepID=A0A8H6PCH5_9EURO|nr:hypothetical protein CNMCM5793_002132 [Aspergillus hiratsukae]
MCYYMPNKPPCTCTYLQLIQPCPQVRLFAVPGDPTPLIQVCPIRYIARGIGQRFCALCSGSRAAGGTSHAVGLVGYPEQGFRALASQQSQQQQQAMPLDPCLVSGGISIGDLLLPMGEESTGSLGTETAGDAGKRDEAGPSVQGSCASASPIQSLLVQDSSGGGLVVDAHGAQVDGVRTVQAAPVEEGRSNWGDEEMRVDGKEDEAKDHAKEVGGSDAEGRASVQGMQIVDLVGEGMS